MGDPITAVMAIATWWQGEEAKDEARAAEQRRQEAERRAELTAEAQRQADIAEKKRQEDLLPPIIGSQTPTSELGVAALEAEEADGLEETMGVQIGRQVANG